MKKNKVLFGLFGACVAGSALLQSCVSDMPFSEAEGEGTLRMQLVVNSNLTRAEVNDEDLASKCVIYISQKDRGLLYQYQGISNLPESLKLKSGNYVAEAWTGDSVPASFDAKFYRGCQSFEMQANANRALVLQCRIANVVVSIDPATVEEVGIKNWTLTVGHSRGSLDFTPDKIGEKGYFMMPNADRAVDGSGNFIPDGEGFSCFKSLDYTLTGETSDGRSFSKTGKIGNAEGLTQHAHEYVLKMVYQPEHEQTGGGLISIEVEDNEVVEKSEVGLYARPVIKGSTFEIEKQIQGSEKAIGEQILKVTAFKSIDQLQLITDDSELGISNGAVDLISALPDVLENVRQNGIDWDMKTYPDKNLATCYITLKKDFFDRLPERGDEYQLKVFVKDGYKKTNEATVRIAVGAAAFVEEDPFKLEEVNASDKLAVRARRATVTGSLTDRAENPVILYRPAGSETAWSQVSVPITRSNDFSVELTNLEPGKLYEYKAADGEWVSTTIYYFTTEALDAIPYGDMESWSTYKFKALITSKDVVFPGEGSESTFWDSGNAGASAVSKTLTNKSQDMKHGGTYSARLETMSAAGVLAAGNLFVGKFNSMASNYSGANITFGRPFANGSHPDALSVWVNYTPKAVNNVRKSGTPALQKGQNDNGQIYIALTTEQISVDTSKGQFVDFNSPSILGFGEQTWSEDFGDGGGLKQQIINIEWRPDAKTQTPKYIIIVCSASKYGDYFEGGEGSLMYVDDFELVYNNN